MDRSEPDSPNFILRRYKAQTTADHCLLCRSWGAGTYVGKVVWVFLVLLL
jgi:hypothetical protein